MTVKREYLNRTSKNKIDIIINKIIKETLNVITIVDLKMAVEESLQKFYLSQYFEISRITPLQAAAISALFIYQAKSVKDYTKAKMQLKQQGIMVDYNNRFINIPKKNIYGVPLQKFQKEYIEELVKPVFKKLIAQYPKDPGDISGRNSLRNRAEMEVRYNQHLQSIDNLKKSGIKLVIASVHADCSKRCLPYQGRVFSLDKTRGITDDGRNYIPLEVATDIYYTTKKGKIYKNGLLGFNCRHYLIPYKNGLQLSKPNIFEEKKEYTITLRQRDLERNVRKWRTEAIMYKDIDYNRYIFAKNKAIEWNKKYIKYSQLHKRAFYPSRTKII